MKHRRNHGFTLLEVLAAVVIILVIAGLVIAAAKSGFNQSARKRAEGEIKDMAMACENYKTEYGSYPRFEGVTEMAAGGVAPIDPLRDGDPNSDAYRKSSAFLYLALSGDDDMNGRLRPPDERTKGYMDFQTNSRMLAGPQGSDGRLLRVTHLKDPFGHSYGYSTAGARQEDEFKADAEAKGSQARRTTNAAGINPKFDLWSTGGLVQTGTVSDADRNGWIKNW